MCAWECIRIESAKTVLNKHNHILGRELLSPVKSPSESLEMDGVQTWRGSVPTHCYLDEDRQSCEIQKCIFVAHICRNARGVRIICDWYHKFYTRVTEREPRSFHN